MCAQPNCAGRCAAGCTLLRRLSPAPPAVGARGLLMEVAEHHMQVGVGEEVPSPSRS